jgi:RNA polymerase sigma-70 factor, ECF subfamily
LAYDFSKYSDKELAMAIADGGHAAFEWVVATHGSHVARTVAGMLGKVAEADDVGQETFIRFYNSAGRFRGDSSIKTYLTRIAINLSLNELKRRKSKRWLVYGDGHGVQGHLSDDMAKKDVDELVQKALEQLEPKFRSVVVLRLVQGYSTKEAADILKLPQGTVLSRLARGQEKLRQIVLYLEKTDSYEGY